MNQVVIYVNEETKFRGGETRHVAFGETDNVERYRIEWLEDNSIVVQSWNANGDLIEVMLPERVLEMIRGYQSNE